MKDKIEMLEFIVNQQDKFIKALLKEYSREKRMIVESDLLHYIVAEKLKKELKKKKR
jgi:hypothetical protein